MTTSNSRRSAPDHDDEMKQILEDLIACDKDITAREVARRHPLLRAASSITRDPTRRALLISYQQRQKDLRQWSARTQKTSAASVERILADREARIAELEQHVELLVGSHVAMLRAVGELGGFSKWSRFFEKTSAARSTLATLGSLPSGEIIHMTDSAGYVGPISGTDT